jgi:hypothetical protein
MPMPGSSVLQNDADKAVQPLPLDEMLVDDDLIQEPQAFHGLDVPFLDRHEDTIRILVDEFVACDHDLAHNRGASTRPSDDCSIAIETQERFLQRGPHNDARYSGLVPAGEIDSSGAVEFRRGALCGRLGPGKEYPCNILDPESLELGRPLPASRDPRRERDVTILALLHPQSHGLFMISPSVAAADNHEMAFSLAGARTLTMPEDHETLSRHVSCEFRARLMISGDF